MGNRLSLGKLFGIEIGLHYSWAFIALMITFSLSAHFRSLNPGWTTQGVWASALLTALLFFAALLAHEMAHALVARRRALVVHSITLFALGGVAQIDGEPRDARSEFEVSAAGPLASILIGGACLGGAAVAGWPLWTVPETPALAVFVWLGYINLTLAAFNLLPAFPLDGGRILRSILWRALHDADRSLRLAARAGRAVALVLIGAGLLQFATGGGIGALWLSFIGFFLFQTAGASYSQARVSELLRGLRVGDLMVRDAPRVDAWTNLAEFLEQNPVTSSRAGFLVTRQGEVVGLLGAREIRQIPEPQWRFKTVADVMRPLDESPAVAPDAPIADALHAMGREDLGQLPVAANGHIEGIISRAMVAGFLEARGYLRG
ncbi:MAG TPA: site-2 protease family protein [Bryobacteraceae bacterium]|nr:site-2 protease family protein [Bryobacteraceae bacterium]